MAKREDFETEEEYREFRRKANLRNKKYYSKPEVKVKKKAYKQEYDLKNKDKIREYGFIKRARPENQIRVKKWREENKEHLREYRRRPDRKAVKKISDRQYWEKVKSNPEKHKRHLKKQEMMRKSNREIIRRYNQKYYTSPKGIINYTHHNHRRLSTIRSRPCDLSNEKIKIIWERDKCCVYCGNIQYLELDHIVSLKNGGASIFNNLVVACESCNRSKSGRDVFFWCKLMKREVPKIVLELLEKQKTNQIVLPISSERERLVSQ